MGLVEAGGFTGLIEAGTKRSFAPLMRKRGRDEDGVRSRIVEERRGRSLIRDASNVDLSRIERWSRLQGIRRQRHSPSASSESAPVAT